MAISSIFTEIIVGAPAYAYTGTRLPIVERSGRVPLGDWPRLRVTGLGIFETSAALAGCLLVLAVAIVLDRRPYRPGKQNYIPIMIIALAASLVLSRHLLTLMSNI
jgi:hypothetical protein